MALFSKNYDQAVKGPSSEQKIENDMEKRIENNMKKHGLDGIVGDENQNALRNIIENLITLGDEFRDKSRFTEPDMQYIQMRQQQIMVDQNFVIIRLLNEIARNQ